MRRLSGAFARVVACESVRAICSPPERRFEEGVPAAGDVPYVPPMAIFHRATIKPTKEDLIANWAPTQIWGPVASAAIQVIGSYRFDDPDGQVGMETFLFVADGELFQVPLTYREAPLDAAAAGLITEMNHSVLGKRWVYDGLRDPLFVTMLAAVTMTGQGEALGMAVYDGRWYIAPTNVRIHGGGWTQDRVPVDGFKLTSEAAALSTLRSDRFELIVFRRPQRRVEGRLQLVATWPGNDEPVLLATVAES